MITFQNLHNLSYTLAQKKEIRVWLEKVAKQNKKEIVIINYIFCDDDELLKININSLGHDDLTDIITFDYNEGNLIMSDIYISLPRVRENAKLYQVTARTELLRVMVHGLLHLCGWNDKTEADKKRMRQKEDQALKLFTAS